MPEIDDSIPSYTEFIYDRRNKGLSTSRKEFFWEIIKSMNEDQKLNFFHSIIEELESENPEGIESLKALFSEQDTVIKKKEVPTPKFPNKELC